MCVCIRVCHGLIPDVLIGEQMKTDSSKPEGSKGWVDKARAVDWDKVSRFPICMCVSVYV